MCVTSTHTRHQDPATSLKQIISTLSAVYLSKCTRNLFQGFHAPKEREKSGGGVEGVEWGWITLDWAGAMALKSGQKNVGLTLFLPWESNFSFKRFVEVGQGTSLWKHTLEKQLLIRLNSRPPQIWPLRKDRRYCGDHRPQPRMYVSSECSQKLTNLYTGHHRRPNNGRPRQSYAYKHLTLTPLNSQTCPEELVRKRSAKRSRKRPSLRNGTSRVGRRSGSRCRKDGR